MVGPGEADLMQCSKGRPGASMSGKLGCLQLVAAIGLAAVPLAVARAQSLTPAERAGIDSAVSGILGDEKAAGLIKLGASDFVLKDRMARVAPAVAQALQAKRARDEQRKLTQALAESELKLKAIFDAAGDGILLADTANRKFLAANASICKMLGYSHEEMLRLGVSDLHPEEALPHAMRQFELQATGEVGVVPNLPVKRKDGSVFFTDINATRVTLGGKACLLGIFRDITERKRSELALSHLNRALKTLSSCNVALVHAVDEAQLLRAMCRNIVEVGGYRLAWVGFAEHDPQKTVRPVAYSGYEEGFMERASVTWADTEQGRGPVGTAIRTRKPQVIQNVHTDPMFEPWRANAVRLGFGSVIALPLIADGKALGALSIYSSEINAFDPEEIRLLVELADDLAYGLTTLRARAAHEQSGARLQRSMEETIAAIAATVEMRDPYTAGHQRRVTELGVAIARERKLPEASVHAIRLAGTIHDLGKINVPAEILSKPSRLTEIEYRLIQSHPQAGYDVLKAIDFPWPIAQIVYQHHERLDGSGYPQGLVAEQILIEARILAVADVVEAMASHRPYRPALGLDAALDEIIKYRGTQFEPAVVDACVALFREKRFTFIE